MKINIKILFIIIIASFHLKAWGQLCTISDTTAIADLDTTVLSLYITGAFSNDLSAANQSVESVEFKFEHLKVSNLNVDLVSPAGQRVRLIGASNANGNGTQNVRWDVDFYRQDIPVTPDDNFNDRWDNDNEWLSFNTYDGSYYPHLGNLDDINFGPVAGEWRLEIIDQVIAGNSIDPSNGEPLSFASKFSIAFRNNDGVGCALCEPLPSTILNSPIIGCAGNDNLSMPLLYEIEDNSNLYGYGHVLVDNTNDMLTFYDNENIDLTAVGPGSYELCGIQYFESDKSKVATDTYNQLIDLLNEGEICGQLSDNCISVELGEAPTVITDSYEICDGEVVSVEGVDYTETGIYEIVNPLGSFCDSISYVDVTVNTFDVEIVPSSAELTCNDSELTLSPVGLTEDYTYSWEAQMGGVIDDENENGVITVSTAGRYSLQLTLGDCTTSIDYDLTTADDFNTLSIDGNNIYCLNDLARLDLVFDGEIESVEWVSDNGSPFTPIGDHINVTEPGVYRVIVFNTSGCRYEEEYEVLNEIDDISASVNNFQLDCDNETVEVEILGMDPEGDYTITWTDGSSTLFVGNPFVIEDAGSYEVIISNNTRSCLYTEEIEITSIKPSFSVLINAPSLTCLVNEVTLEYIYLGTSVIAETKWYRGSTEISQNSTVDVTTAGMYELVLITEEGCTFREEFEVEDLSNPEVLVIDDVLMSCIQSVNLLSDTNPDYDYRWEFPDGSIVDDENPVATFIGTYQLTATSLVTGCVSTTSMEVINDDNFAMPSFDFAADTLTCSNPTPSITPSFINGFTFDWDGPGVISANNTPMAVVDMPGVYTVEIVNEDNTICKSSYVVDVQEDTNNEIELTSESLNCVRDSAQIFVNTPYTFSNIQWAGPSVSDPFAEEPFVRVPTNYYVIYTLAENGCQGVDTIAVPDTRAQPNVTLDNVSKDSIGCDDEVDISILLGLDDSEINTLSWSGPGFTAEDAKMVTVTMPGTYQAIAVGIGECKDTLNVVIRPDTIAPILNLSKTNDIFCNQLESVLNVDESSTYASFEWMSNPGIIDEQNGEVTINEPGQYFISSINENNCTAIDTIDVLDSRVYPEYEILPDTILTCEFTDLDIGISADEDQYSIAWDSEEGTVDEEGYTINVANTGRYFLEISNEQECIVLDTISVGIDTITPKYDLIISNEISCLLDSAVVRVDPVQENWSYNWEGSGIGSNKDSIQINQAGEYLVEITDINGCKTEKSFSVTSDTVSIKIDSVYADPLSCNDASYLYVATDSEVVNYNWSGPGTYTSTEPTPILLDGGRYDLTISGANGCESSGFVEISDDRLFPILGMMDVYLRCDGAPSGFIIDTIAPNSRILFEGLGFDYFEQGFDATTTIAGTYEAIAINEVGCQARDTFEVINEESFPEFSIDADALHCDGATIYAIDAEDDESVLWLGPGGYTSSQLSPRVSELGAYELIVTSIFGCSDTLEIEMMDGRVYPDIDIIQEAPLQCNTEEVTLLADVANLPTTGLSYSWTTNSGGVIVNGANTERTTVSAVGNYEVVITHNETTCKDTASFMLIPEEQSFVGIEYETITPTCEGYENGEIEITNFDGSYPPYSTVINGFNYGEQNEIKYLASGEYILEITDDIGCKISDTIVIDEPIDPLITLPGDTTIYEGSLLTFTAGLNLDLSEIDTIVWKGIPSSNSLDQEVEILEGTEISLLVIDNDGCMVEQSFRVGVIQPERPFPNVFTPNGDMNNDYFYIPDNPAFESIVDFKIYDNWGSIVYEGKDIELGNESAGWDGTFKGKDADQAVYVAYIVVKLKKGGEKKYFTTVTLIR